MSVYLPPCLRQPRGAGPQRKRYVLPRACARATWLATVLGELVPLGCICCAVIGLFLFSSCCGGGAGLCSFPAKLERRLAHLGMHIAELRRSNP